MAKRGAIKELTHENWEDEEEPEDMGTFRQASSDQLAGRNIKKARRRGGATETSPGMGIFKGLTSFTSFGANKDTPTQPSFSFLSKDTSAKPTFDILSTSKSNTTTSFTMKSDVSSPEKKAAVPTFKFTKDPPLGVPKGAEPKTNGIRPSKVDSDSTGKKGNKLFLSHLKALNEGVVKWVKQHLDTNPHVNLSPVFDDYKKHFEELTKKYPSTGEGDGDEVAAETEEPGKDEVNEKENKPLATKPTFSFTSSPPSSSDKSVFGGSSAAPDKKTGLGSPAKPSFSFGAFDKKAGEKSLFGGSTGTSNIFGSFSSSSSTTTTTTTASTTKGDTEADPNEPTDEPPKVEVNEVKEDDAVYEKKCKLFYMKDGAYVEKGVGTLFLKPAGEKTQLLIRALTNLGNILLNIILNPTLPTARAGKNGVIIACIPNPPLTATATASNEPVKMLIRVKTAEDADALNEKITELKK